MTIRDFLFNKKKVNIVTRNRILENRDLKNGILLNRNERVENFENKILFKIFGTVKPYDLGKYPDQNRIYNSLSKFLKIKKENLLITSGIDGSIKSIFEIFTGPNEKLAVLDPSYAMYEIYSKLFKTKLLKIKYKNFKIDKKQLYKIINDGKIKILFLPNPNQPIEDNLSLKEIKKISSLCKKNKIMLVIDEAYYMFGSQTAAKLCVKEKHVIVLRTFSKSFGLPSIRLGHIIAHKNIINIFNSYRLSYESNFLSDKVAEYFINNFSIIKKHIKKVIKGRDFLKRELNKIGIISIGGKANFLLVNIDNKEILIKILEKLKTNKIYVKSNYPGDLANSILITCGYIKTMKKFLKVIKEVIKK